jgi:hypothetical protein
VQANAQPTCKVSLTHVQLNALLRVFKYHITSFWACKRRSHLDVRVLRRLIGQDSFVDFESSDTTARGLLISCLRDIIDLLQCRYKWLLAASTATCDNTWNKWVLIEREMIWRALGLAVRGLHSWGAVLWSQLHSLQLQGAPGTPLMMLKAVCPGFTGDLSR